MFSNHKYIAFETIVTREVRRFSRIWLQTLVPPAITIGLYFVIFGNLVGRRIGEMGGFQYMEFIMPGLIMMSVIQNSYSNVVSSFYSQKFQKTVEEILYKKTQIAFDEFGKLNNSKEKIFVIAGGVAANKNIRTLGVALSPCILPEAGKPTFEISEDEIEIGMGIHGEPGIKREKLRKADPLVDDLCERLLKDIKLQPEEKVSIMINSLGSTPLEELYIISKRVNENLSKLKIKIIKSHVGRYATSMEMAGMSITILKLTEDLEKNLLSNSKCPFWTN